MPNNLVKTKQDEKLWNKAKRLAKEQGHEENWEYVNSIYQNLKGKKDSEKSSALWQFEKLACILMPD